jgi:nitrogen fixation/metabolism regulation signal transduction histidine kinase
VKAAVAAAKKAKASATTSEEKVAATHKAEAAAKLKKEVALKKFEGSHMFVNTPSADQLDKKIAAWAVKIKKAETDLRDKEQNKEVLTYYFTLFIAGDQCQSTLASFI